MYNHVNFDYLFLLVIRLIYKYKKGYEFMTKKIDRAKTKRIQARLTEQEYSLIMDVLKDENISELVREFLKNKVKEKLKDNEILEKEIRERLYSDFFKE